MKTSKSNRHEVIAGLVWVVLGLAAIFVARGYAFGTITRMGPGFVPIMLGILLVVFGLFAAWQGRRLPEVSLDLRLRPFAYIIVGIIVWVLLVDWAGFVPATVALILISAQSEPEMKLMEAVLLAAGMSLVGYLIFIRGIGIPIAAFGS
ncbi:tripartite tricarboxylate transporter TctB family protein [Sulfitobacter sp. D7]|jgi:hypothetical protein|uniref:tripartite tricarboxylate transporter TctB family protein n=1 Tax=Sulfitobacter sp. D7 TaxID=1968541 RepID=UPI000E77BA50|nr:tripartite tricarboxylate transporter TctB family protein [Sulfitobacter sp. D7]AYE85332.1 hypothetical protein B5M07_03935 [Sulfitobacter sp. D7]